MAETEETNEEIVMEDNQVICALTDLVKPAKSKELSLQSLIAMLVEEYGFDMTNLSAGSEKEARAIARKKAFDELAPSPKSKLSIRTSMKGFIRR